MKPSFALIGPGKVGCAVGRRLYEAGYPLLTVVGRNQLRTRDACAFIGCETALASLDRRTAAAADIVLLSLPDDQLASEAQSLQAELKFSAEQVLLHFSGLYPAALLKQPGASTRLLSIHPLLPFADNQAAYEALPGCPCALEGDNSALALGKQLITALRGTAFTINSENKALYHTAACIASNFLVTLLATARDLLNQCGIEAEQALPLLLPLLQATLNNSVKLGPEAGLTGPIVRGDHGTVQRQLQTLKQQAPQLLPLYRILAEQTIELAKNSGRLTAAQAEKLR